MYCLVCMPRTQCAHRLPPQERMATTAATEAAQDPRTRVRSTEHKSSCTHTSAPTPTAAAGQCRAGGRRRWRSRRRKGSRTPRCRTAASRWRTRRSGSATRWPRWGLQGLLVLVVVLVVLAPPSLVHLHCLPPACLHLHTSHVCTHARTCAHTHTHTHARACTNTCARTHVRARKHAHTYTHTHAHTHTHVHARTCTGGRGGPRDPDQDAQAPVLRQDEGAAHAAEPVDRRCGLQRVGPVPCSLNSSLACCCVCCAVWALYHGMERLVFPDIPDLQHTNPLKLPVALIQAHVEAGQSIRGKPWPRLPSFRPSSTHQLQSQLLQGL